MKCAYCSNDIDVLVRDHVVPRSRGGPDNATNIVMACALCNSAKSDMLASEWLGDRCPEIVKQIESSVHAKLESGFASRGKRGRVANRLFACHVAPAGDVDFVGEVISDEAGTLKMELLDPVMAVCGIWSLSGEIKAVTSSECRYFKEKRTCLETMLEINIALWKRPGF